MPEPKPMEKITEDLQGIREGVDGVTTTLGAVQDAVSKQEERIAKIEERQAHAAKFPGHNDGSDDTAHERQFPGQSRAFSWSIALAHVDACRNRNPMPDKDHWIKRGFAPETVERTMSADILTDGGFLIPDEYVAEIIPALRPQVVLMQAGARTLDVPAGVGQIRWPKENAVATTSHVAENEAPTESTPTVQQVVANPHEMRAFVKIPMNLIRMGSPSVEQFLRDQFLREMAIELDRTGLRGLGAANEPLGVANFPSLESVEAGSPDGGPLTYNLLLDLETFVFENNVPAGNTTAWITSHRGWREVRQLLDSQNRPLFHTSHHDPGLTGAPNSSIFGHPIFKTTQVPSNLTKNGGVSLTELYFALWQELMLVRWGGIEVRTSRDAYDGTDSAFLNNLMFLAAFMTYDWVPFHEESFGLIGDIETA